MVKKTKIMQNHPEHENISFIESDHELKETVSIPSDFFALKCHHLNGRALHTHNCIEMFYILSGSCTHIVEDRNKRRTYNQLTAGYYYIMDHSISHGFENLSKDFHIVNILFLPHLIDASFSDIANTEQLISHPSIGFAIPKLSEKLFNQPLIDKNGKILRLFERAWQTYIAQEFGARSLFRCYITEILIISLRNILNEGNHLGREQVITFLCAYIDKHYAEDFSLAGLCAENDWNNSFVSRKFKEVMGITFETYLQSTRCRNACILLVETRMKIEEIGEKVGYPEPCHFRKIFKRIIGTSASAFRRYNR